MNFNEWNDKIKTKGIEWGESQLLVLELSLKNQKELIEYNKSLKTYDDKPWRYKTGTK